ncbi:MAG TPA: CBS domain-containing protein [Candidatus Korarchaeota archaeon]|nr:CBS domain-containing protein [Candidatus Korarchaeota archaeon]
MRWALVPPPEEDSVGEGLKVSEVMTPKVIAISPDRSVAEAARIMKERDIGSVVVMEGEKLVGIVTERDIITRFVAKEDGRKPEDVKVEEIMTKNPVLIGESEDLIEAARIMSEKNIRRLVVVNREGKVVGIISARDIVRVAPHVVFILRERLRLANSWKGTFPV